MPTKDKQMGTINESYKAVEKSSGLEFGRAAPMTPSRLDATTEKRRLVTKNDTTAAEEAAEGEGF